jgi:hypothetical protein
MERPNPWRSLAERLGAALSDKRDTLGEGGPAGGRGPCADPGGDRAGVLAGRARVHAAASPALAAQVVSQAVGVGDHE